MEKLQVENEYYKLYSPDSLKYITEPMHEILLSKIKQYNDLFDILKYRQVQINYFDDLGAFREFVLSMREDKSSLPDYARGTYDRGMINHYIENNIVVDSPKYIQNLYRANHELFHVMYMELILKGNMADRIVWYDEGMAKLLSGEWDYLNDSDKFKNFFTNVKNSTKAIPNLNDLSHGEAFQTDEYNGYYLSYLAVRYLSEILSLEDFKSLMRDFEQIKSYGKSILCEAFAYFEKKYISNMQM